MKAASNLKKYLETSKWSKRYLMNCSKSEKFEIEVIECTQQTKKSDSVAYMCLNIYQLYQYHRANILSSLQINASNNLTYALINKNINEMGRVLTSIEDTQVLLPGSITGKYQDPEELSEEEKASIKNKIKLL